jgi:very-long-chain (3R)-3-hydroxyacyl-CoA dehydratase
MAVLEVLHAMLGLVKSPWTVAFMQVFSRVWTLWAIMDVAPDAQNSIFTLLACTSWGLVEVPRYLFYALNLVDAVPDFLFWLRYSLFFVLYPTGITGELGCMYYAFQYLQTTNAFTYAITPEISLSLKHFIALVALTYIPGSPKMYFHMVKTRSKQYEIKNKGILKKDDDIDKPSSSKKSR